MAGRRLTRRTAALAASLATTVAVTAAGPNRTVAADTPTPGGTLNVLSTTDADYLDPNVSYYAIGYSYLRPISRQLYSYPAVEGEADRAVPDLATDLPTVSDDGLTYTVTLRTGVMWNTSPPRQVTAVDVVRGVKVTCNPQQPFGGVAELVELVSGMKHFCRGFARAGFNARDIRRYVNHNDLPGVEVGADPQTVVFTLKHRATYFTDMLTLPAFSPRPRELMDYAPGSAQEAQHTISDGPYMVSSYKPTQRIVYVRNPAWDAVTDPLRKAYVDRIVVTMNDDAEAAQQAMESGSVTADAYLGPMPVDAVAERQAAGDPNMTTGPLYSVFPYILFNCRSPNNDRALRHKKLRRAISYALDRTALLDKVPGGDVLNRPQTHALPSGIVGSEDFDRYPHDTQRAKDLMVAAGLTDVTLKYLYRPSSPSQVDLFHAVRRQLAQVGIDVVGVPAPDADYYTKYLQNPSSAQRGTWDLAASGWGPDWLHDAAHDYFHPLFDGRTLPPRSYDFGLFDDTALDALIDQASSADSSQAADLWHQADLKVMSDAAFYPIDAPLEATYHAGQVHNFVFLPALQSGDFSNVWLDPAANGG